MTKASKVKAWQVLAEHHDARTPPHDPYRFGLCSTTNSALGLGLLTFDQYTYLHREIESALDGYLFLHYRGEEHIAFGFRRNYTNEELTNMRVMWCELMALMVAEGR